MYAGNPTRGLILTIIYYFYPFVPLLFTTQKSTNICQQSLFRRTLMCRAGLRIRVPLSKWLHGISLIQCIRDFWLNRKTAVFSHSFLGFSPFTRDSNKCFHRFLLSFYLRYQRLHHKSLFKRRVMCGAGQRICLFLSGWIYRNSSFDKVHFIKGLPLNRKLQVFAQS